MATVANVFIDQGSDYSNIVTVTASNGQPLNLTGFTAASQIRKSYSSTIAYSFNASILTAAAGRVRLQLTAEQSEAIPPGRYLYDVEVTSSGGAKTRVVEGVATITPQITKV
jgi:hypothetical protein